MSIQESHKYLEKDIAINVYFEKRKKSDKVEVAGRIFHGSLTEAQADVLGSKISLISGCIYKEVNLMLSFSPPVKS